MLRYLLDAHVSPAVARELQRWRPQIPVARLEEWCAGRYRHATDEAILAHCWTEGWTLVTGDRRIARLLKAVAEQGRHHGGVVLLMGRGRLDRGHLGSLVADLERLWERLGEVDWTDRVVYL